MWRNFFKPEHINWRRAYCLITGVYLHLFVMFFKPFKGDKVTFIWTSTYDYVCHMTYNYAHVVFFCALAILILPKRYPTYFLPENMSFQRFILLATLAPFGMGVFYFWGNYYFFHFEITFSWFFIYMFKIMVINTFFTGIPYIIAYLSIFNYFTNVQSNNREDAPDGAFSNVQSILNSEKISVETPPQYPHEISVQRPIMLSFTDSANKKSLDVALNHLYYITSAQNYIEIFHGNNEIIKSTLLRQSLKTIEENMILSTDSPLIRCHKAFIVNREKVVELRGTAKTAHFILQDLETTIPVSRQKYPEVELQFLN